MFVGVNLGDNTYKLGFICLIGIAHLTEAMNKVKYHNSCEIRPLFSTSITQIVEEELIKHVPK